MQRTGPGDSSRHDLPALRHERLQQLDVLEINIINFFGAQTAAAAPAWSAHTAPAPAAVSIAPIIPLSWSWHNLSCITQSLIGIRGLLFDRLFIFEVDVGRFFVGARCRLRLPPGTHLLGPSQILIGSHRDVTDHQIAYTQTAIDFGDLASAPLDIEQ